MNHLKNTLEKILNPYALLSVAAFLIIFAFFFEQSDLVKEARVYLSYQDFQNKSLSCDQILKHRPWYGQVNSYGFLWTFLPPLIVFSFKPNTAWYWQLLRTLVLITGGHALIICAVLLTSHVPYEIFSENSYWLNKPFAWRPGCVGSGSVLGLFFFGWIPSAIYSGIWLNIWKRYHLFFLKTEEKTSFDFLTKTLFFFSNIFFHWLFWFPLTISIIVVYLLYPFQSPQNFWYSISDFTMDHMDAGLALNNVISLIILPYTVIFL